MSARDEDPFDDMNDEPKEEEGRLFFAGDDPELNDALDAYLTRTPPHPDDPPTPFTEV
jgi:hypothetical protein